VRRIVPRTFMSFVLRPRRVLHNYVSR
jgi:hypothetical protein